MVEQTADTATELFLQRLTDPPASIERLIESMPVEVYENLRTVIEIGRWPSGERLTPEQLEFCMQATILYEAHHLPEEQRLMSKLPQGCGRR